MAEIGVSCVTLANNHAVDFGPEAPADTLSHLAAFGIVTVGAGADERAARAPVRLSAAGQRLKVVALADDPASYAAASNRPGIAFADLRCLGVPDWVRDACRPAADELVLAMVHWGPNMTSAPVPYVRAAAETIEAAGATLGERGSQRVEGLPVRLEYGHTRPADSGEARQLLRLLDERCAATGSRVELVGGRLVFAGYA